MKCKNCPFTLLCYTGYLTRATRQTQTYFCPICRKLIHMCATFNSVTAYALFCEKCTLTPEIEKQWKETITGRELSSTAMAMKNPIIHINSESPLLFAMCCPKCMNDINIYTYTHLKWVELG